MAQASPHTESWRQKCLTTFSFRGQEEVQPAAELMYTMRDDRISAFSNVDRYRIWSDLAVCYTVADFGSLADLQDGRSLPPDNNTGTSGIPSNESDWKCFYNELTLLTKSFCHFSSCTPPKTDDRDWRWEFGGARVRWSITDKKIRQRGVIVLLILLEQELCLAASSSSSAGDLSCLHRVGVLIEAIARGACEVENIKRPNLLPAGTRGLYYQQTTVHESDHDMWSYRESLVALPWKGCEKPRQPASHNFDAGASADFGHLFCGSLTTDLVQDYSERGGPSRNGPFRWATFTIRSPGAASSPQRLLFYIDGPWRSNGRQFCEYNILMPPTDPADQDDDYYFDHYDQGEFIVWCKLALRTCESDARGNNDMDERGNRLEIRLGHEANVVEAWEKAGHGWPGPKRFVAALMAVAMCFEKFGE
ncbi:hypothetical protein HDU89_000466 [Geranomyces variabilis]|nr:hypothetical protein HDU89_000466 [Geranomyces variabilis]